MHFQKMFESHCKGLPEFAASAAGVKEEKSFSSFCVLFKYSFSVCDDWRGNVPFCKIERVTEGKYLKLSPVCPSPSHKSSQLKM